MPLRTFAENTFQSKNEFWLKGPVHSMSSNQANGTVPSPGDAVLPVSRDAQVAWPLACSQNELSRCVKCLLPSFVCCLSANKHLLKQVLQYAIFKLSQQVRQRFKAHSLSRLAKSLVWQLGEWDTEMSYITSSHLPWFCVVQWTLRRHWHSWHSCLSVPPCSPSSMSRCSCSPPPSSCSSCVSLCR